MQRKLYNNHIFFSYEIYLKNLLDKHDLLKIIFYCEITCLTHFFVVKVFLNDSSPSPLVIT